MNSLSPVIFQFLIIGNGISRRDGYDLLSFTVLIWLCFAGTVLWAYKRVNLICHNIFSSDTG